MLGTDPAQPSPSGSGHHLNSPKLQGFDPLPPTRLQDDQSLRGEDYDLLSSWARTSPRLYPSYSHNNQSNSNSMGLDPFTGSLGNSTTQQPTQSATYRTLAGDSPMLGPTSIRRDSLLSVGVGLSPVLGPARDNTNQLHSTNQHYDFSAFGQYHTSPSALVPGGIGGLAISRPMVASPSGHSFSNLGDLPDLSPANMLPPPLHPPPPDNSHQPPSSLAGLHHSISAPALTTTATGLTGPAHSPPLAISPAQPLTPQPQSQTINPTLQNDSLVTSHHSDLQRPAHQLSAIESSNLQPADARIRAYAKLEFPEFDFYIQKLSVIIGRRPAAATSAQQLQQQQQQQLNLRLQQHLDTDAVLAAATAELAANVASQPVAGPSSPPKSAKAEQVNLGDFMVGMEDEVPQVKVEADLEVGLSPMAPAAGPGSPPKLAVPTVAVIPSSPAQDDTGKAKGKGKADPDDGGDPFAEFLRSSPVLGPTIPNPPPPVAPSPLAQAQTYRSPLRAAQTLPALPAMSSALSPRTLSMAELAAAPLVAQAAAQTAAVTTDIDLGPIRAVSRQHARLYFDYEMGGWAIEVLGRNGVVVEGKWKAKGEREPLSKR